MRSSVFASLVFAAVVVLPSEGRTQIHYVSHDGDNIYPYTSWETAAHRIQDAVDAAADQGGHTWWGAQYYGGDVHIAPGVYEGRVLVSGTTMLIGAGAAETEILSDSYTLKLMDWAGLMDLTIRTEGGNVVRCEGQQHLISRCRVVSHPNSDDSAIWAPDKNSQVLLLDSIVETRGATLGRALISGCTFREGSGAWVDEGTVVDSVFEDSAVSGRRLTLLGCTIRGGSGVSSGDALFMQDCEVSDCWDGVSAGDCVISRCVIRGSRFLGIYAKTESGARISDCVISGNGSGIMVRAAAAFERQDGPIVIEGCVVTDNSQPHPTQFTGVDGILVGGSNVSISNCVSANNGFPGVGGAGIALEFQGRITNSTVVGNARGGIVGKGEVLNSIIWGNHEPMSYDPELAISYSCVEGGYPGRGNISVAPGVLFADYRLPPDSPCIDAGDPACDYNLEPEPNGKRINLGAFGNTPNARTSDWVDTDSDNMRDDWEMLHFGDLSHDGSADTDADGLTDYQEYFYETNPVQPDSDGDGMWDGAEIEWGMDPLGPGAYVKLVKMEMEEGGVRLVWRVFPRVTYQPLFSDTLRVWRDLDSVSTPKYRYVERVDPDVEGLRMRFYRLFTVTRFPPPGL